MTDQEKLAVMEDALTRLKGRGHLTRRQVVRVDDFMADMGLKAMADLYDLIRFHAGPEQ